MCHGAKDDSAARAEGLGIFVGGCVDFSFNGEESVVEWDA